MVCNLRFHPALPVLREAVASIGKPLYARAHFGNYLPNMRPGVDYRTLYAAWRERGGGIILDAIHELDYLFWIFGRVTEVGCVADRLSDLDMDVEDYAVITLRHESGFRSSLQLDYLRPFKRRGCEVVGDQGMILWTSEGKVPEHCRVALYRFDQARWQTLLEDPDLDVSGGLRCVDEQFLNAVAGRPAELLDGRTALAELRASLDALRSAGLLDQ